MNVALALEYEAVCMRAGHLEAARLSGKDAVVFLNTIFAMAQAVETHYLWRPQLCDSGDEMVLAAAINGKADALITFNRKHFGTAPARFGVEVLLPREALVRIRQ